MRAFARSNDRSESAHDDELAPLAALQPGRATLTDRLRGDDAPPIGNWADDGHDQAQLAHLDAGEHEDDHDIAAASPEHRNAEAEAHEPEPPEPAHDDPDVIEHAPEAQHAAATADPAAEHDEDHDEDHEDEELAHTRSLARAATATDEAKHKAEHKKKHKKRPKWPVRGERLTDKRHQEYFAKRDRFNRKSIKSNRPLRKNQIGRPGVRVANRDSFQIAHGSARRFKIASGQQAELLDVFTAEYLKPTEHNPKGHRLALNPKHTRKLTLPDGSKEWCVFVWLGSRGPGWMRVDDIKTQKGKFTRTDIKRAVNRKAAQWAPSRASAKQMKGAKRYVFITPGEDNDASRDAVADQERDRYTFILTGQKPSEGKPHGGGNHTADYLTHTRTPDGMGGKRDYINICMNLPAHGTPPVAIEVSKPGEFFFVPTDKTFHREIAIYGMRKHASSRRQVWVYGYVAKMGPDGPIPDEKRRGWVPLRVIKRG